MAVNAPTREEVAAGSFISVAEACARTGLRPTKMYGLMDSGQLSYLRADSARRVSVVSLEHYIATHLVIRGAA